MCVVCMLLRPTAPSSWDLRPFVGHAGGCRLQEVRLCLGEGEMYVRDEVDICGTTVTVTDAVLTLDLQFTRCFTSVFSVTVTATLSEGRAGRFFLISEIGKLRHGEGRCPTERQREGRSPP